MRRYVDQMGGVFSGMIAAWTIVMFTAGPTSAQRPNGQRKQTSPKATQVAPGETPELKRGKALINVTAYQLTQKKNMTLADYTKVIDVCAQGMAIGVDKATGDYAVNLMAWAHNKRGEIYAARSARITDRTKRTDLDNRSMSEFETAIQLNKNNWRAYHNRGVSLARLQDYDGALVDFNKAIKLQPRYPNAFFNRGECRYAKGEYTLAIGDYSKALRLNPRDAAAFNSRGHARYRIGNIGDALADYNQAVRFDPKNEAAYANRGDIYNDQGLYGKAAADFRKAIQLNPNFGRAYKSAAWLMATCPDKRYRDAKKAIAAATKAIDLDGADSHRYLDSLGGRLCQRPTIRRRQRSHQTSVEARQEPPGQKFA